MLLGRGRGGCRLRGSGGVGAEACCRPPCLGRSKERGTQCRLPSTGGAIAVHQEVEEHRAVHQRCPVPSHGTASESLSPGWGPSSSVSGNRTEIFFFSPLSSLSLLILPSPFLSPRLSLPPGMPRPPCLEGTPRPARGDGGMWRVGQGREPWERSEAGGVNDNENLRHSPVSSPTEELQKDKRRSDDSERQERTRPGF